jgi:hypothetical protein
MRGYVQKIRERNIKMPNDISSPVKNYDFEVCVDNVYTVGCMAVCNLGVGHVEKISFSRGIMNTREDRIFHNWLVDPPRHIALIVEEGRVVFNLDNIEVSRLDFSDLDAGGNNLMVQQIILDADVTVHYAGVA